MVVASSTERRRALADIRRSRWLIGEAAALAESALARGDLRGAMIWVAIAAEYAWAQHPGYFASSRLERVLVAVAERIHAAPAPPGLWAGAPAGGRRVLHVLTRAYQMGGHGRLVEKWIRGAAQDGEAHSVVLLEQGDEPVPAGLAEAAVRSGGTLVRLDESDLLCRAEALRALWQGGADVLALSAHPHDPVPTVALGVRGGPPVLLVNSNDHTFWLGVSVADSVLDFRECGRDCSTRRRGVRQSELVELAVAPPDVLPERAEARCALGVPEGVPVLLTIASDYKYAPFGPWDFPALAAEVLSRSPEAHLVAAGPRDRWGWSALSERYPDRVHALGNVPDIGPLLVAADLYLDSFPFVSATSVVEAGLTGLPVQMGPRFAARLMASEDGALDGLPRPETPDQWVEAVVALAGDPDQRRTLGHLLSKELRRHHVDGQREARRAVLDRMTTHDVSPFVASEETEEADVVWATFQRAVSFPQTFGLGLITLRGHRRHLRMRDRLRLTVAVLAAVPAYTVRPRLGARMMLETLRG